MPGTDHMLDDILMTIQINPCVMLAHHAVAWYASESMAVWHPLSEMRQYQ